MKKDYAKSLGAWGGGDKESRTRQRKEDALRDEKGWKMESGE